MLNTEKPSRTKWHKQMRAILNLIIYLVGLIGFQIIYSNSDYDLTTRIIFQGAFGFAFLYLITIELIYSIKKARHIKIGDNFKGKIIGTFVGFVFAIFDILDIISGEKNIIASWMLFAGLIIIVISWIDSNHELILLPKRLIIKKDKRQTVKKTDLEEFLIENKLLRIRLHDKVFAISLDNVSESDIKYISDWKDN